MYKHPPSILGKVLNPSPENSVYGPKVEKHFPHQRILLLSRSSHRALFGQLTQSSF
jgi:hypothetical protein